jgi:hypothetical protein
LRKRRVESSISLQGRFHPHQGRIHLASSPKDLVAPFDGLPNGVPYWLRVGSELLERLVEPKNLRGERFELGSLRRKIGEAHADQGSKNEGQKETDDAGDLTDNAAREVRLVLRRKPPLHGEAGEAGGQSQNEYQDADQHYAHETLGGLRYRASFDMADDPSPGSGTWRPVATPTVASLNRLQEVRPVEVRAPPRPTIPRSLGVHQSRPSDGASQQCVEAAAGESAEHVDDHYDERQRPIHRHPEERDIHALRILKQEGEDRCNEHNDHGEMEPAHRKKPPGFPGK